MKLKLLHGFDKSSTLFLVVMILHTNIINGLQIIFSYRVDKSPSAMIQVVCLSEIFADFLCMRLIRILKVSLTMHLRALLFGFVEDRR